MYRNLDRNGRILKAHKSLDDANRYFDRAGNVAMILIDPAGDLLRTAIRPDLAVVIAARAA
jgi:hypothetical protein